MSFTCAVDSFGRVYINHGTLTHPPDTAGSQILITKNPNLIQPTCYCTQLTGVIRRQTEIVNQIAKSG